AASVVRFLAGIVFPVLFVLVPTRVPSPILTSHAVHRRAAGAVGSAPLSGMRDLCQTYVLGRTDFVTMRGSGEPGDCRSADTTVDGDTTDDGLTPSARQGESSGSISGPGCRVHGCRWW